MSGPGLELADFSRVDEAADPQALMGFLDRAKGQTALRTLRTRMVAELRLDGGGRVLDAGCGLGTETTMLAMTAGVEAFGIDSSRLMVEEARRRAAAAGSSAVFAVGDVSSLPFPAGHFDAVHALTLLEHVPDPAAAVAELVRVTRPGGRVVVADLDQGSTVLDHPDVATTRQIMEAWVGRFAQGRAGRGLRRLLLGAGLTDLGSEVVASEFAAEFMAALVAPTVEALVKARSLDRATADEWWAAYRAAQHEGRFTAAACWFLAAGTVPGASAPSERVP